MIPGRTYFIEHFKTELDMLTRFVDYVQSTRVQSLSYFNGHGFDLPMLMERLRRLEWNSFCNNKPHAKYQYNISFSHWRDVGAIRYRKKDKSKNCKLEALRKYIKDNAIEADESCFGNVSDDGEGEAEK